jgi:hypothetical protein
MQARDYLYWTILCESVEKCDRCEKRPPVKSAEDDSIHKFCRRGHELRAPLRGEYARSFTSFLRSEFCTQPHQRKHVHELSQGAGFTPFQRR